MSFSSGSHIKNPIWVVAEAEPVHVSGENVVYDTDGLRSIRRESILSDIDQDWDYVEASLKLERKARYFYVNAIIPDAIFMMFVYTGFFVDRLRVAARHDAPQGRDAPRRLHGL